jgi:hypothetical protein
MIYIGNKKILIFLGNIRSISSNIVIVAFIWGGGVDGDEALNYSSLQFFRSVKRCMASLLLFFFFWRLTLHRRYFLNRIIA